METYSEQENYNLIGKYLSKELKPEEQLQFEQWLRESAHNQDELKQIHKSVAYLESNLVMEEVNVDKARMMTDFKIWKNTARNEQEREDKERRLKIRNLYSAAAVILLLVANAVLFYFFIPSKISSGFTEVAAPLGARSQVTLADGTVVWLNAGSTIRYANNFSKKNRAVQIEGEAFFDVTHDPAHPFIVSTSSVNLTVLGTAFNLRAYRDENTVEATLVRGKVEIEKIKPLKGEQKIILKPNQKATYLKTENKLFVNKVETAGPKTKATDVKHEEPKSEIIPSADESTEPTIEVENTIAWKEGYLVFDNDPLSEIMLTLSRRYNVNFTYQNKDVLNYRFTGKFKETTLEQVLQAIMLTSPLEATVKQNHVTIREITSMKKKYTGTIPTINRK